MGKSKKNILKGTYVENKKTVIRGDEEEEETKGIKIKELSRQVQKGESLNGK
jgi:hypothetical protein